jgi:hypothetical protein
VKSLILLSFLLAGVAGAAPAPPTPADPAAAKQAPPPGLIRRHSFTIDSHRLATDRDYAIAMLEKLDAMAAAGGDATSVASLQSQRILALFGAGRVDEAGALIRAILASRPVAVEAYRGTAYAALEMRRPDLFIEAIEAAANRFHTPGERAAFRTELRPYYLGAAWQALDRADRAGRGRLAEALLSLDYVDHGEIEELDTLRSRAAEARMARGDLPGARALVAEMIDPGVLLGLLVQRRYEPLFDPAAKPEQIIAAAIAQSDRISSEALSADPASWKKLLGRARFLRSVGRNDEALALLLPRASDSAAVAAGGEDAAWVVDAAASSLLEAGRGNEGVALLNRLLSTPGPAYMVNLAINFDALIGANGDWRRSAEMAAGLDSRAASFINPYGAMWVWSTATCGYSLSGDARSATSWLAKVKAHGSDNVAAHLRALVCAGDLDGAERLMVAELGGGAPEQMLFLMQEYRLGAPPRPAEKPLRDRLGKVKKRPAVQAAAARVGRILSLPLPATWGDI